MNMNKENKKILVKSLQYFILGFYFVVTLFSFLGHNHELDGHFHDNCPACQWEIQTFENDTISGDILSAFSYALQYSGQHFINQNIYFLNQYFHSTKLSRAPPSII